MHSLKQSVKGICQWIPPFYKNQIIYLHPMTALRVSHRHFRETHMLTASLRTSCCVPTIREPANMTPKNSQPLSILELDRLSDSSATPTLSGLEADEPDELYHMIEIEIRCGDPAVLTSYNKFITLAAGHLGLTIGHNEVEEKPHKKRWTVLKSVFGHKKHMVQYEVRTYHHKLTLLRLTGSTADTFLEYIQRNLPEGVAMRVGRVRMEKLPDHLLSPPRAEDLEPTFADNPEDEVDEKQVQLNKKK